MPAMGACEGGQPHLAVLAACQGRWVAQNLAADGSWQRAARWIMSSVTAKIVVWSPRGCLAMYAACHASTANLCSAD